METAGETRKLMIRVRKVMKFVFRVVGGEKPEPGVLPQAVLGFK
jgi:hypothetical protein